MPQPQAFASLAVGLCLLASLASGAGAAGGLLSSVEVPRPTPQVHSPPATARCCAIDIGREPGVVTSCPKTCYLESWDGPLLIMENLCDRAIWVSYEFEAVDEREYRTPCYILEAGQIAVAPEPSIEPTSPRRIVVAMEPGLGFPRQGFLPRCGERRERILEPGAGER